MLSDNMAIAGTPNWEEDILIFRAKGTLEARTSHGAQDPPRQDASYSFQDLDHGCDLGKSHRSFLDWKPKPFCGWISPNV